MSELIHKFDKKEDDRKLPEGGQEFRRNRELRPEMTYPEGMRRICLTVEYNGSSFHGFQAQASGIKNVQHELESALSSVADENITIVCAGRTDAGVHASYQVIHFDTLAVRPLKAWSLGVNARMGAGVSIQSAYEVTPNFHSRFSALYRTYRYVIYNNSARSAILSKIATWEKRPLNVDAMKQAAKCLVGKHDFSAFRASRCQSKTPVRTIERIRFAESDQLIVLEVKANAFLHHMIRNIVGSLFAVGFGDKPSGWVGDLLALKDRRLAAATAPSDGLYLVDVGYPEEFGLPKHRLGPVFLPDQMVWVDV
ncbi:MAG: tRNA pseudouridine(38-40) synthase TruA [Cellvibrionaceae bacterium]